MAPGDTCHLSLLGTGAGVASTSVLPPLLNPSHKGDPKAPSEPSFVQGICCQSWSETLIAMVKLRETRFRPPHTHTHAKAGDMLDLREQMGEVTSRC